MNLEKFVRTVPDFPEPGIMFRDVTTIFNNADAFRECVNQFAQLWNDTKFDAIAGIDARGFIIGSALSYKLGLPFIPLRKKGKLPFETISERYELEYGEAILEVRTDSITERTKVLIVDDLIATGGTVGAAVKLIMRLGGEVAGCGFIIQLPELGGVSKLELTGIKTKSLLSYGGH
jgi:adenine phosphoribosyltransferase